jgi:hypothetical protein
MITYRLYVLLNTNQDLQIILLLLPRGIININGHRILRSSEDDVMYVQS